MYGESSLVAAGNTYNPCLILLKKKGYQLRVEDAGERLLWHAQKDASRFMAYTPPELLGIIGLWEEFGTNWNIQQPNLIGELTEELNPPV